MERTQRSRDLGYTEPHDASWHSYPATLLFPELALSPQCQSVPLLGGDKRRFMGVFGKQSTKKHRQLQIKKAVIKQKQIAGSCSLLWNTSTAPLGLRRAPHSGKALKYALRFEYRLGAAEGPER